MKIPLTIEDIDFVAYISEEDVGKIFKALRQYVLNIDNKVEDRLMPFLIPLKKIVDKQKDISQKRSNAGSRKNKNLHNQHACKSKIKKEQELPVEIEQNQFFQSEEPPVPKTKLGTNIPPTFEEVCEYIKKNSINVDASEFFTFNESKGWYIGKNKMKNWHMAIATWARRGSKKKLQQPQKQNALDLFNNIFMQNGEPDTEIVETDFTVISD